MGITRQRRGVYIRHTAPAGVLPGSDAGLLCYEYAKDPRLVTSFDRLSGRTLKG